MTTTTMMTAAAGGAAADRDANPRRRHDYGYDCGRCKECCECCCTACDGCDDFVCLHYVTNGQSSRGCADCVEACVKCKGCGENGCECGECCGKCECSGGDSDGAAGVMLLAGLALLVVFVMIGIVVGIFFTTVIFQRVVQSHVVLLHMRAETKRYVVRDLAQQQQAQQQPQSQPPSGTTNAV